MAAIPSPVRPAFGIEREGEVVGNREVRHRFSVPTVVGANAAGFGEKGPPRRPG